MRGDLVKIETVCSLHNAKFGDLVFISDLL